MLCTRTRHDISKQSPVLQYRQSNISELGIGVSVCMNLWGGVYPSFKLPIFAGFHIPTAWAALRAMSKIVEWRISPLPHYPGRNIASAFYNLRAPPHTSRTYLVPVALKFLGPETCIWLVRCVYNRCMFILYIKNFFLTIVRAQFRPLQSHIKSVMHIKVSRQLFYI